MTRLFSLQIFLTIIIVAFLALKPGAERSAKKIQGLPWQIETLPDGATRVFGITPGRSTLGDARDQLGDDMELAIIAAAGQNNGLEMFYRRYTAGMFSGKLVISADIDKQTLERLLSRAARPEHLRSGARKYRLNAEDLPVAYQAAVKSITFIPTVDFDEATVVKRFGTPAEKISGDNQVTHFLYPDKGLDLIINPAGKDILQYVAPRDFSALRTPLQGTAVRDATPPRQESPGD